MNHSLKPSAKRLRLLPWRICTRPAGRVDHMLQGRSEWVLWSRNSKDQQDITGSKTDWQITTRTSLEASPESCPGKSGRNNTYIQNYPKGNSSFIGNPSPSQSISLRGCSHSYSQVRFGATLARGGVFPLKTGIFSTPVALRADLFHRFFTGLLPGQLLRTQFRIASDKSLLFWLGDWLIDQRAAIA